MIDKQRRFKQRLDQLQEVITSGFAFYSVWNKLRLRDEKVVTWSLERQNQVLGRWRGFFTPVGIGLQRIAMIEIAKVFDSHSSTVSLTNLLKEAERDGSLVPNAQPSDLMEISDRLRQAKATRATIRKLRNQRLAHADATPEALPSLMNQSIESLIEDIKFAFNRLSAAHDGNVYSWEYALHSSARDTTDVLRVLVNEVDRREIQHDDEMVEIVNGHIGHIESTLGRPIVDDEFDAVLREFAVTSEQADRVRQTRST